MLKEIFPSVFLVRAPNPAPNTQFSYLLRRAAGNVLFVTKDDMTAYAKELDAIGGVATMFLGDRHHAGPRMNASAELYGATIICSQIEAKAIEGNGVSIHEQLKFEGSHFAPDLEIIPTPGHTKGAFSYLWNGGSKKFLFIGDTLVPINGRWEYYVSQPNRASMLKTVERLATVEFDVLLSNSFAASPVPYVEMNAKSRDALFAELSAKLSR